jgi:hypothetical protein
MFENLGNSNHIPKFEILGCDKLLLGIKDWIKVDMWNIKKVLESQRNTHNKFEVQANSESRSLTLSPTRSPGLPCLQIEVQDASDLCLDDLQMHRKIRR